MREQPIRGLVAAPHAPLTADGAVALEVIESQAAQLESEGVRGAYVCGATGEFPSLSFEERDAIAQRWLEVARGMELRVIVHVGGTRLREARELARRAAEGGADAIAALAPFFFRPSSVPELVDCCAEITAGAPELPFYYYEIPALTGVRLPMDAFLRAAGERLPGFAGIKFTNPDLVQLQKCVALAGEDFDILYGQDESLLGALELGVHGAVGSTYNFAAGLYLDLKRAFDTGQRDEARAAQRRSIELVDLLASHGYMGAAKRVMGWLGVHVGPPRAPLGDLEEDAADRLRAELEAIGFFHWRRPGARVEW